MADINKKVNIEVDTNLSSLIEKLGKTKTAFTGLETTLRTVAATVKSTFSAMSSGFIGESNLRELGDFNMKLFELSRTARVSGQSFSELKNSINDISAATKLSKQEAASFVGDMNQMTTGARLSGEAITKIADALSREYGPSLQQIKGAMTQLAGAQRENIGLFKRLNEGMTDNEAAEYVVQMRAAKTITREQGDEIIRITHTMNTRKGAESEAEKRLRSYNDSVQEFSKEWENLRLEIAKPVIDQMKPILTSIASMTKAIREFIAQSPGLQKAMSALPYVAAGLAGLGAGKALIGAGKGVIGMGQDLGLLKGNKAGGGGFLGTGLGAALGSKPTQVEVIKFLGKGAGGKSMLPGSEGIGDPYGKDEKTGKWGKRASGRASKSWMSKLGTKGRMIGRGISKSTLGRFGGRILGGVGRLAKGVGIGSLLSMGAEFGGDALTAAGHTRSGAGVSAVGSIGGSALTGAAIGSFIPGIGTAIGAVAGTAYGFITNFKSLKTAITGLKDPTEEAEKAFKKQREATLAANSVDTFAKRQGIKGGEEEVKAVYENLYKGEKGKEYSALDEGMKNKMVEATVGLKEYEAAGGGSLGGSREDVIGMAVSIEAMRKELSSKGITKKEEADKLIVQFKEGTVDQVFEDGLRKSLSNPESMKAAAELFSKSNVGQSLNVTAEEKQKSIGAGGTLARTAYENSVAVIEEMNKALDKTIKANQSIAELSIQLDGNYGKALELRKQNLDMGKQELANLEKQLAKTKEMAKTAKDNGQARAAVADLESQVAAKRDANLDIQIGMIKNNQTEIDLSNQKVSILEAQANLVKQTQLGAGPSLEMQGKLINQLEGVNSELEKQLAGYMKLNPAQRESPKIQKEINNIQLQLIQNKAKEAEITKTLREGYLDAMSAMTNAEGTFSKFVLTKDYGMGEAQRLLGAASGARAGMVGAGLTAPTVRFGEGGSLSYTDSSKEMAKRLDVDEKTGKMKLNSAKAIEDAGAAAQDYFQGKAFAGTGSLNPFAGSGEKPPTLSEQVVQPAAGSFENSVITKMDEIKSVLAGQFEIVKSGKGGLGDAVKSMGGSAKAGAVGSTVSEAAKTLASAVTGKDTGNAIKGSKASNEAIQAAVGATTEQQEEEAFYKDSQRATANIARSRGYDTSGAGYAYQGGGGLTPPPSFGGNGGGINIVVNAKGDNAKALIGNVLDKVEKAIVPTVTDMMIESGFAGQSE